MKVTVRDCLQLDSFRNCIVVAGERKMENRVRTVSVMDAADASEAVKCSGISGMMALTTPDRRLHSNKKLSQNLNLVSIFC